MTLNYRELDAEELEFVEVAKEGDLKNGERLFVDIDTFNIVLFNIAGRHFAIGDVCSHDDGPLGDGELEETQVVCPRHGARFEVSNGKALTLPAVRDIPAFPVRVQGGRIEIGVPLSG